jgi:hypothetical protein
MDGALFTRFLPTHSVWLIIARNAFIQFQCPSPTPRFVGESARCAGTFGMVEPREGTRAVFAAAPAAGARSAIAASAIYRAGCAHYSFCTSPIACCCRPCPGIFRQTTDSWTLAQRRRDGLRVFLGLAPDGSCWHRAPDTGALWPRRFFADIPIHAGNSCGDIRIAWEPSRLQHLVLLAMLAQQAEPGRAHQRRVGGGGTARLLGRGESFFDRYPLYLPDGMRTSTAGGLSC